MATETLRPSGAGDECNIRQEAGATCPNHYQNVDEVSADNWTTVVKSYGNTYFRDLYNIANSGLGAVAINKVTVFAKCIITAAGSPPDQPSLKIAIKTGGTAYEGTGETLSTSWTLYSKEWANNPNTGSPWTVSELNSLQVGIALRGSKSTPAGTSACTQVYVVVEYTPGIAKSSSDSGSGLEGAPVPTAALAGSESGQGLEAISSQLAAITAVDGGISVELGALLKELFASELGRGADSFAAKIESPTRGGGMKLWI